MPYSYRNVVSTAHVTMIAPKKLRRVALASNKTERTSLPPKSYGPPSTPKSYDELPFQKWQPQTLASRSHFTLRYCCRRGIWKSTRPFPRKLRCVTSPQEVTIRCHPRNGGHQGSRPGLKFRFDAAGDGAPEIYQSSPQEVTMPHPFPKKLRSRKASSIGSFQRLR
jgi:hypothetical protein